ncbi:MAG: 3-hydroxybutyryl-CoA dehydrogenase [Parasporobacterium sp.]|nr:3-hydroxybutyryl-CoA dehydrogenase [Parasporobacterium sp.]
MNVGIIGTGTMGTGIALAFAQIEGYHVRLSNVRITSARDSFSRIEKKALHLQEKGILSADQTKRILSQITVGSNADCTDCDLIIETVPEDLTLKKQIFQELMTIVPKDCLFTSNTSSLSVSRIEHGLDRPVVGMHFFNPADRMKLVEVVRGENTPASEIEKIMQIAHSIGKTPVQAKEYPGFVVNRILIPMLNEAMNVFAEGTATAEGIDTAMELGASHPMGPLHLADLIGLDVCLAIMEVIYHETGDHKYAPSPLLKQMVKDGQLGKKSGKGFFDYNG